MAPAAGLVSLDSAAMHKVWEVRTLGRERDAEARRLLEDAAAQVQPIMRARRWRVALLTEFSPRNASLLGLNVNGGQEVRIRLRRPGRDSDFFPYEHVLGTLLHELVHIEHGPHDAKFYKLLDDITKVQPFSCRRSPHSPSFCLTPVTTRHGLNSTSHLFLFD
eukprot:SM000358S13174  [mRNA]  locus=s358:40711:41415:+ [translate_table: standard]